MPDILPNWHPAAVHFPIALSVTATLLLLVASLCRGNPMLPATARLLLYLSAGSALLAVALGWHAYLTVEHDAAGHAVMLRHRNWAMASTAGLLLLSLWSAWCQRAGKNSGVILLPAMLLISGGLGFTGWLGGEMVYRHGVGVLPSAFPSTPPVTEEKPAAAAEIPARPEPAVLPGEHVHKDGKRHRH
mgnify:CR=1 FL=1|jgi:uncharacterized membrane protein